MFLNQQCRRRSLFVYECFLFIVVIVFSTTMLSWSAVEFQKFQFKVNKLSISKSALDTFDKPSAVDLSCVHSSQFILFPRGNWIILTLASFSNLTSSSSHTVHIPFESTFARYSTISFFFFLIFVRWIQAFWLNSHFSLIKFIFEREEQAKRKLTERKSEKMNKSDLFIAVIHTLLSDVIRPALHSLLISLASTFCVKYERNYSFDVSC